MVYLDYSMVYLKVITVWHTSMVYLQPLPNCYAIGKFSTNGRTKALINQPQHRLEAY